MDHQILAASAHGELAKAAVVILNVRVESQFVIGADLFIHLAQGPAQIVAIADEKAAGGFRQVPYRELHIGPPGYLGLIHGEYFVFGDRPFGAFDRDCTARCGTE